MAWTWRLGWHVATHLRGVCRHGLVTRDSRSRAYAGYTWSGHLGVVGMGTVPGTVGQLKRLAAIRAHAVQHLAQGR